MVKQQQEDTQGDAVSFMDTVAAIVIGIVAGIALYGVVVLILSLERVAS